MRLLPTLSEPLAAASVVRSRTEDSTKLDRLEFGGVAGGAEGIVRLDHDEGVGSLVLFKLYACGGFESAADEVADTDDVVGCIANLEEAVDCAADAEAVDGVFHDEGFFDEMFPSDASSKLDVEKVEVVVVKFDRDWRFL